MKKILLVASLFAFTSFGAFAGDDVGKPDPAVDTSMTPTPAPANPPMGDAAMTPPSSTTVITTSPAAMAPATDGSSTTTITTTPATTTAPGQ